MNKYLIYILIAIIIVLVFKSTCKVDTSKKSVDSFAVYDSLKAVYNDSISNLSYKLKTNQYIIDSLKKELQKNQTAINTIKVEVIKEKEAIDTLDALELKHAILNRYR